MPKVGIILVNYNNWFSTIQCLESLLKNNYKDIQIIVVDNNSKDNSLFYIENWAKGKLNIWIDNFPNEDIKNLFLPPVSKPVSIKIIDNPITDLLKEKIVVFKNKKNKGFAGGVNTGLRYILKNKNFKYIWILNNDTVVDKGTIYTLIKNMEKNTDIGLLGSKILFYNNPSTIQVFGGGYFNKILGLPAQLGYLDKEDKYNEMIYLEHLMGASIFIRREVIEKVGFLREDFFLYLEDTEFSLRVSKSGWRLACEPLSKIWHKDSDTVGKKSGINDYYVIRNSLFFVKENFGGKIVPLFFYGVYKYIIPKLIKGEWKRLKFALKAYVDFFFGKKGKLYE